MPSFYSDSVFRNTVYAANAALVSHFASMLLDGDASRVVYSSTEYALHRRIETGQEWNNANLPFMNYKVESVENGVDRRWWNAVLNTDGMWISELGRKVRLTPVTISYDATLFIHRDDEMQFAMAELLWDDSNETQVPFAISIEHEGTAHDLGFPAVLGYNLQYEPQFSRSDWLEQNKIHSIQINPSLETFIMKESYDAWVPEEVVFNFARSVGEDPQTYDEAYTFLVDHMNERVIDPDVPE